jgi:hypothetical protein
MPQNLDQITTAAAEDEEMAAVRMSYS